MSNKIKNSSKKQVKVEEVVETAQPVEVQAVEGSSNPNIRKVKMIFSESKFYNDLANPIFGPGKVYELEGDDWIQRWIKRGGTIVESESSDKQEKVDENIKHDKISKEEDSEL